jgi:hypothetical protein
MFYAQQSRERRDRVMVGPAHVLVVGRHDLRRCGVL